MADYVITNDFEPFLPKPPHQPLESAAEDATALQVSEVTSDLKNFKNLKSLFVQGFEGKIPGWVYELEGLEALRLFECGPKCLTKDVGAATNLRQLVLDGNGLKKLPPEIGHLRNLEVLDVQDNMLAALPDEVEGLTHLAYLNVGGNPLSKGLQPLEGLRSLEMLNLGPARFNALPEAIGQWPLKHLFLTECSSLSMLPQGLAECPLETIYAYECNKLSVLPEARFDNLKSLVLFGGKFKSVPTGYWSANLRHAQVAYRPIQTVPEELRSAKDLRVLKLWHASLKKLPTWLAELTQLEELDLRENSLKTLPDLSPLQNLRTLKLGDNPWDDEDAIRGALSKLKIDNLMF